MWQRSEDETWHAVYAFTDPVRLGVFGIRVDAGDLTGDAITDILSFEDVGGSGACGTYRVIATTVGRRERDLPPRSLRHPDRDLVAVISGSARPSSDADDPHCCPSAFRESVLRWNGTSWDEISSEVVPNDPAGR